MPTAEIIAIGTELLLGEIADTNTQFIARTIRDLGINIFRTSIVGDNKDRIAALVREAMIRSEIIITTGGLGPTVDDPTREALAMSVDTHLVFHPELWETITKRFFAAGRIPGENQKQQAFIPHLAIVLNNPVGTAPAFIIKTTKNTIVSLPGVPAEMKTIMEQSVIPYLINNFNLTEILKVRILHTSGAGEGWIDEKISDLEELSNPTVGLAAHSGIVDIRITVMADNDEKAEELISNVEIEIRDRLGDNIYGIDDDTLEMTALDNMAKYGWTVFSVESGTGGILYQRLSKPKNEVYLTTSDQPTNYISINQIVENKLSNKNADVIVGLSVIIKDNSPVIRIFIHTPVSDFEHQVNYSGPPQNAPLLGVNLLLDRLRRINMNANTSK